MLVEQGDRFRCVLEQRREVNILCLESVVECFAVGDVDRDTDGSGDVAIG